MGASRSIPGQTLCGGRFVLFAFGERCPRVDIDSSQTGYEQITSSWQTIRSERPTKDPRLGHYLSATIFSLAAMRHLMPIITPRLILRPPTLGDLDTIQTAKEQAWPDLQRWMTWAFNNQLSRQAMEDSIRRTMDYQSQAGIALAGFHRTNGNFVVRTALDLTDEQDVDETGYWVAPKYSGQGRAPEAANAAIRYAFGHLRAKAISIGYFDRNEPSRRIVEKLGFQKLRVAHNAATRCLDGTKLDRHEYILTSPDALPELDVSWG